MKPTKQPKNSFAARLRRARGKKRTQSEAAKLLGVSVKTYVNWEQGRNVPDPMGKQGAILAGLK